MASPVVTSGLLPRLRAWFNLSQPMLGQCLGLSREMISQVERGLRGLPLSATLPQAALTLAYQTTTDKEPTAEPLDAAALLKQQRACEYRAVQLAFELSRLPERALWARRRLAALPTLRAVLAPGNTPAPTWLADFEAGAHTELARSGSTAQALLRARLVALEAEAAELARLLGAA
ncbi:hypothetical protein LGH70_06530 [Hymenobacter sp. BT635]|uniref:XRE family transcriptional regulator n=1 Tax=Hymenobacter nitidus TaxID=2880929 RepID=A0ABS8AA26_9BACT|nr:hypothetical protein [Hymenobacter nitidus]MCB2377230.1 hypothetical protein [Hymenobacter nitidus]